MKLALGFAIGVALGIVFAPAPGNKTRIRIASKVRELGKYPERMLEEKMRKVAVSTEQEAGEIGSRIGKEVAESAVRTITAEILDKQDQRSA